ncbi:MAG: magnesium transporter CorA family protein [Sphingomicrobium sp.]
MLRLFGPSCSPAPIDPAAKDAIPESAVWIDLLNPSPDEEKLAENLIGQNIPTRTEMLEIEPSSRLYERDDATVMTMSVLYKTDTNTPAVDPVSFILTDRHLVTLRYVDPAPFIGFADHAYGDLDKVKTPLTALIGLMDAIIDRLADRLEEVAEELDRISQQIFRHDARASRRSPEVRYEALMLRLGAAQRILAKTREASVSATRLLGYLSSTDRVTVDTAEARHLKSLAGDAKAINDHSNFVGDNLTFLLDASLGMIGLQQNLVMKIFSVVAVVLMPPTLIAGVYGMNFEHMPELRSVYGYPIALATMLASAIIPYWLARRKGWL